MSSRLILALGLVVGLPTLVQAQMPNRQMQQRQMQQAAMQPPLEIQGKIQGMAKGGLMVATNNNQVWRVGLMPVTRVHVTGTTTAAALRTGAIIEFTAMLDDRGNIQGKVDALTVISLSRGKQFGVVPADQANDDGVVDGFDNKAKPDVPEKGSKRGKRPPRTSGKAARDQAAGSYHITGKLNMSRNGSMAVLVGRNQLPFELSESAKIDVNMFDFSLASLGNDVSVKGYLVQGKQGMMQAAEVQVKLPEAQGDGDEESSEEPANKKPAGHAKKPKDEPLPEPADEP